MVALRWVAHQVAIQPGGGVGLSMALALIVIGIAVDFGWVPVRTPSTGVQVPPGWRHSLPPAFWVPAYGVLLGFTLFTRITSGVVLGGLIGLSLSISSTVAGLGFGAVYGLSRTAAVLAGNKLDAVLAPPRYLAAAGAVSVGTALIVTVAAQSGMG